jgi:hypothetical protein
MQPGQWGMRRSPCCSPGSRRVKVDCQMNQRDADVPFAAAAEKISAIRRDFPSPPLNNVGLI